MRVPSYIAPHMPVNDKAAGQADARRPRHQMKGSAGGG